MNRHSFVIVNLIDSGPPVAKCNCKNSFISFIEIFAPLITSGTLGLLNSIASSGSYQQEEGTLESLSTVVFANMHW